MPWSIGNIPDAFKGLTKQQKKLAISIANGALRSCLKDGGTDKECAPKAIRVALAKVKEKKVKEDATVQATETVADKVVSESVALREDLSIPVSLSEAIEEDGVVKARACLLEQGWSLRGHYYGRSLLPKLAAVLEGAGSFNGHIDKPGVQDYNGVYHDVHVVEGGGPTGRDAVKGMFFALDPHIQRLLKHAPHLVNLSINGKGKIVRGTAEGRDGFIVEDVDTETPWTCDTVIRASARGGIDEVLEALEATGGNTMDLTSVQDLKNAYPKLLEEYAEEVRASVADELQEQGDMEKMKVDIKEAQDELAKTVKERDVALRKIAIVESRNLLEKKLGESKLHESLKGLVRKQFADTVAEEAAVDALVKEYTDLAVSLAEKVEVTGVKEEADNASESDWELLVSTLGKDGE
jgi:uncharacterized protein YdaT